MDVQKRPRTVTIKSVGCRTNQEEMTDLGLRLAARGDTLVDTIEDADVVIVNTCTVTSGSESKTRNILNAIARKVPHARVLVTGCLAQNKPQELFERGSAHWVVGNTLKDEIPSILDNAAGGIFHEPFVGKRPISPMSKVTERLSPYRTRFPLKIQEGCDYACAYCIVPQVRGPSRSAPFLSILDTARDALAHGCKELVITGTHIGQFRANEGSLATLVKMIAGIRGDFRIRLTSLDPRDIDAELLALISSEEKICDHVHISFQSLDESTLRLMDRPFDRLERFLDTLQILRAKRASSAIGADLIVGFPGETEQMFRTTVDRARTMAFSYAHVFRFSKRPGTKAVELTGQVPESVKSARSEELRNVVLMSREKFIKSQKGARRRILIETENPASGVTSNFLHVEVTGYKGRRNTWLDVVVGEAKDHRCCYGTLLTNEAL